MSSITRSIVVGTLVGPIAAPVCADATGQEFTAFVNYSPFGGQFEMSEEVLGTGPVVFGTPTVFATTAEGVRLVLETSEIDLGNDFHELTFNFVARNAAGQPSPFTVALPIDLVEWGISGLSWGSNSEFLIVADRSTVYRLDGTTWIGPIFDLYAGQSGDELDLATRVFAGGGNLTPLALARYEITLTVFEMPGADCPADLDGSGAVDFGDILAVLAAWGNAGGPEDLDESGLVDFGDLLVVLGAWGPCA